MRTELQAKFIHHLNRRQREQGFTLVELLVVIVIIGILAAIALPNFLTQSAKAKQTGAKQNVSLINRYQTAYRAENTTFANTFDILATGVLSGGSQSITNDYNYNLDGNIDSTSITAAANNTALKSYSGGTFRYANSQGQSIVSSLICEANNPGTGVVNSPIVGSITISCPSGYKSL
jgi:type IV pilus assembly protein PilA